MTSYGEIRCRNCVDVKLEFFITAGRAVQLCSEAGLKKGSALLYGGIVDSSSSKVRCGRHVLFCCFVRLARGSM